jgi:hypothetical protein
MLDIVNLEESKNYTSKRFITDIISKMIDVMTPVKLLKYKKFIYKAYTNYGVISLLPDKYIDDVKSSIELSKCGLDFEYNEYSKYITSTRLYYLKISKEKEEKVDLN